MLDHFSAKQSACACNKEPIVKTKFSLNKMNIKPASKQTALPALKENKH